MPKKNKYWPHEHSLTETEHNEFKIQPYPPILEWAEQNITLISPGYVYPGPYNARPWQKDIINSPMYWDNIYMVGATQVGKSTNADIIMYYYMAVMGLNGMVCYANTDTVDDVFKLRIKDMIINNRCLKENWSGAEDDLTVSNIKLKNCLWRVASAQNKNSLSSFAAAVVIGSEVAKWQKQDWNPVLMLRGRQGAYSGYGELKSILESSPFEVGDYLYKEIYKPGNLIVTPHYKCLHCGHWIEFTDNQIKMRHKDDPHTPEFIRGLGEKAVRFECPECKQEITEHHRAQMAKDVKWVAPAIEQDDFKQTGETILADGTIKGAGPGGTRHGRDSITFNFNRLVDTTFPFFRCLALFFETKNDPQAHRTYENETMARWKRKQNRRIEIKYLESKKVDYFQYGEKQRIPPDCKILTLGVDTQDDGFYYAIFGWGFGLSCWLIRHDFINLPIDPNQDHNAIYIKFRQSMVAEPLRWADGSDANFKFGLMDRGGHRAEDVDCICNHYVNLKPYVGYPKLDLQKEAIFRSEKGDWFIGQPELLSDFTGTLLESESLYFPQDVQRDFLDQIWRQFKDIRMNRSGIREEKWIHGYMGPDHYRDCFNLAWGAAKYLKLDRILFNPEMCENIKQLSTENPVAMQMRPPAQPQQHVPMRFRTGQYFNRALGRNRP